MASAIGIEAKQKASQVIDLQGFRKCVGGLDETKFRVSKL